MEKPLSEVYEAFLRYPHLPVLKGWEVLEEAVRKGVEEGTFGLRVGGRHHFQEPCSGSLGRMRSSSARRPFLLVERPTRLGVAPRALLRSGALLTRGHTP